MKKVFRISLIALLGFTMACSEEFLDRPPYGVVGESQLATPAGVNALLIGAYSVLDGFGTGGTGTWDAAASNFVYGSIASDNAYKGTDAGDQPPMTTIERFVHDPALGYFNSKWNAVYDGVSRSNDVLKVLAQTEGLSDTEKKQIEAEARFLRAHYHFEAVQMWKNVCWVDETVTDYVSLSNAGTPWDQIEADFQYSIDNLPAVQDQVGRATSWAAKAYKGKAHLFQQEYAAAKTLFDDILNNGPFSLTDCYHDNFRIATNNNDESIFEIQNSVNDGTTGENGNFADALNYPYTGGPGTCCGFHQPSQNLVNAHKTDENGLPLLDNFNDDDVTNDEGLASTDPFTEYEGNLDPRLDWSVGRRGVPYLDWGDHPGRSWIRDQSYGGPYAPKKNVFYKAEQGSLSTASGWAQGPNANNIRLIRLSHVILWRAEIAVEENDLETARTLVNRLRARAKNGCWVLEGGVEDNGSHTGPNGEAPAANYVINEYPAGAAAFSSQASARKAVQFETRIETAMEGNRFFDLVRWGIAAETMNTYFEKEKLKRTYLAGVSFQAGKHEYYPIPQQQIDIMTNLTQNPNY
ncbi:MAG: RagB/SusD family nutrient uptake outer membrane protein [Bacteroidia bacterium]